MTRKMDRPGRPNGAPLAHLKAPFLEALKAKHFIAQACEAVGIGRSTVYEWLENDPAFSRAVTEVKENTLDLVRAEAYRRAVDGVEEPVTVAGEREMVKKFSDGLLIRILQAHDPAYREGSPTSINITFVEMLVGKWQAIIQRVVPIRCPHCDKTLDARKDLAREMEMLGNVEMDGKQGGD